MPHRLDRFRAIASATLLAGASLLGALPASAPAVAVAAGPKVAIIVGPVGSLTNSYRSAGDGIASAATAAGATVVKAYSPNATWANVKAAVEGANVIVYLGHGNGYPNPYTVPPNSTSAYERIDRVNGWGLNRVAGVDADDPTGDGDNWSTNMAYCGEQALLGELTSSSDSVRKNYCGGTSNDGINPAPGFTMVYSRAHYTAGFGERYTPETPLTTLNEAQQHVRNYSYPILALGGTFIATAYGDADDIVERVLTESGTPFGEIFAQGEGYSPETLTKMDHPDINGAEVWVQSTELGPSMHFGDPDYWYAFAGDPSRTPSGGSAPFFDVYGSPFYADIVWLAESGTTQGCGSGMFCPDADVTRAQMASFLVRALDLQMASTDYFWDDGASPAEPDINRLAAAGVTGGCGMGKFCPYEKVQRSEMASFIRRALALAGTETDHFWDDDGIAAEADINSFAEAGITTGCEAGRYCPADHVTRAEMAAFLHRALAP